MNGVVKNAEALAAGLGALAPVGIPDEVEQILVAAASAVVVWVVKAFFGWLKNRGK